MYAFVLALHSIVRWIVLLAGLAAVIRAAFGWFGKRPWESLDDRVGLIYTISMDIQLLLGLLLYFVLSPIIRGALSDLGTAMSSSATRFFVAEHFLLMLLAVVLAHLGRSLARRQQDALARHKRAAIFYGLSLLAVLVATPWPFFEAFGRRLLPF